MLSCQQTYGTDVTEGARRQLSFIVVLKFMADKEHLLAQSSYDFSQGHISRPEEFLNPITQVMNPIFCTPPRHLLPVFSIPKPHRHSWESSPALVLESRPQRGEFDRGSRLRLRHWLYNVCHTASVDPPMNGILQATSNS
jgi:hypothetical protein